MKLKLTKESMGLLNWMFRAPNMLSGGIKSVAERINPYKAKDEIGAREVRRINLWLEKRLPANSEMKAFEGRIEKCYVERMKAVVKHFEDIGRLSYISQEYLDLCDQLEGKEPVPEEDDIEISELEDEKESKAEAEKPEDPPKPAPDKE